MGHLSFDRAAGQKLLNRPSSTLSLTIADEATLNESAGKAILRHIRAQNLDADGLAIQYDDASGTAMIRGHVADQATREKIILCAGNIQAVAHVNDQMTVSSATPQAKFYVVVSGDTLSKISREMYGDANRYTEIFEANKPMLSSPERIYPGLMLRIPALA